ncbi:MAG: glycosyltransferase [Actinobacteria bacterium]|nr:glycosyltransferase [Actinomycetota bacterium]
MGRAGKLFQASLNAAAFLLCASFIAYVLLIVVPFLRRKPAEPGDERAFCWHFIIPCLDEQAVIAATVKRLMRSFPTVQLWCVDDASSDATPLVLARLARRYRRVHVVARRLPNARHGKGAALNAGWEALRASLPAGVDTRRLIVGVVDADGRLDPRCLAMISGPSFFGISEVGAVQVKVRVAASHDGPAVDHGQRGLARLLVRLQDLEFACVIAAMQTLRRHVGTVGMGGNGQFTRLSVLEAIGREHGTPWHGALLEDFELGLHVLLSGSRTEYCHDTYVIQEGLPTARQLVRQRSRWAQGSMQCFRYLMPIVRSPRISAAGAIEIAYFLFQPWLQLFGSLIYALCAVIVAGYALTFPGGPLAWLSGGAWGIVPLFVVFGLGPFALWGPVYRAKARPETSVPMAVALGLANWLYLAIHYMAIWWAFARVVRTRHDWKKTARLSADLDPALRADGLPAVTLQCVLRFAPTGPASSSKVVPGRIRFPASSTEKALTEVS